MPSGPPILIIGGGSVAWTPRIVRDILLHPLITNPTITLYDTDLAAAELIGTFLNKLTDELKIKARIRCTDRMKKAFDGAQYALITVSTGGLDAMAHDLALPARYGIYQTVGDSTGPGGWARFIRNYPVFVGFANDLNRYAPGCVVLNYTNPMCTLTDVLARRCDGPVVGLCHGLFENIEFFQQLYKIKDESDLSLRYGGLNHFFWVTAASAKNRDLLADLSRKLKKRTITELAAGLAADPMGFSSGREIATELFRATGIMPYIGDRHTSEFFNCYLTDRKVIKRYKLAHTTVSERRRKFIELRRAVIKMIDGEIPKEFLAPSRETAADIIAAHLNNRSFIDVGNLPNRGQIENLPRGVVVETAMRVDANGFEPLSFGPLPPPVHSMCQTHALAYQMQVRACLDGDRDLALRALRLDPLCSHLTWAQITELGNKLLKIHRGFIGKTLG